MTNYSVDAGWRKGRNANAFLDLNSLDGAGLSEKERANFMWLAYSQDARERKRREEQMAYVLDDRPFLRRADLGEVHKALSYGWDRAEAVKRDKASRKAKELELENWRRSHRVEYEALKSAYAAVADLFPSQEFRRGKVRYRIWLNIGPDARAFPRGEYLQHAVDFLQDVMKACPALALAFPDAAGAARVKGESTNPLARAQKETKAMLQRAKVSAVNRVLLMGAIGLVPIQKPKKKAAAKRVPVSSRVKNR